MPIYAEGRAVSQRHADRGYRLRANSNIASLREGRWKLILYPGRDTDQREFFRVSTTFIPDTPQAMP